MKNKKFPGFAKKFLGTGLLDDLKLFILMTDDIDLLQEEMPDQAWLSFLAANNVCLEYTNEINYLTKRFIEFFRKKVSQSGTRCYNRPDRIFDALCEIFYSQQQGSLKFKNFMLNELINYIILNVFLDESFYDSLIEMMNKVGVPHANELCYYFCVQKSVELIRFNVNIKAQENMKFNKSFGDELAEEIVLLSIIEPIPQREIILKNFFSTRDVLLVLEQPLKMQVNNVTDVCYGFLLCGEKPEEELLLKRKKKDLCPEDLSLAIIHDTGFTFKLFRQGFLGGFLSSFMSLSRFIDEKFYYYIRMRILMELHCAYDAQIKQLQDGYCYNVINDFEIDISKSLNDVEDESTIKQYNEVLKQSKENKSKLCLPACTCKQVIGSLLKLGCKEVRQTGSHLILQAPNGSKSPVPVHNRVLGIGLILKILKSFEISRQQYVSAL